MRDRRRRIIWNNDAEDLSGPAFGREGFPARLESVDQFLGLRMKGLVGTEVDSLFYCGYTREHIWNYPTENIRALGPDPLKHVVNFAHQNGMEFVFSIRMNDSHTSFYPEPRMGRNQWKTKLDHPEWTQANVTREEFEEKFLPWVRGQTQEHPLADVHNRRGIASRDYFSWSSFDYAHPEVRAHYLGVVEGACQRYDLDGIELDWGRHPFYFRSGEERKNVPVMTDFVRQVRQRVDEYARKRGRPILLAMRVADSPALSLSLGLDAETWVGEGWVDLLIAGFGYMPFTVPLGDWVRLGRQNGVPVYGCLSRSTRIFSKPEAIRAAAYRYWDEGADGISFFNFFFHQAPGAASEIEPEDYAPFLEVGEPGRIARRSKLYEIDQHLKNGYMNPDLSCWPGQLPLAFSTESGPCVAELSLQIADRPETASRVTVQVQWQQGTDQERVSLRLNGQTLANPHTLPPETADQEGFTEYQTRAVHKGNNTLEVKVQKAQGEDPAAPVVLQQVRVSIAYS